MAVLAQPVVVNLRDGTQAAGIVTGVNEDGTVEVTVFEAGIPRSVDGVHLLDTEDAATTDAGNTDGYCTAWAPDLTVPAPVDEPSTPADFIPAPPTKTGK